MIKASEQGGSQCWDKNKDKATDNPWCRYYILLNTKLVEKRAKKKQKYFIFIPEKELFSSTSFF